MVKYEFTEEQNQTIDLLSKRMVLVSVLFLFIGIMSVIQAIIIGGGVYFVIYGITMIIFGVSFYLPTDNFKNIVKTEGRDIKELMDAFREINTSWTIIILIILFSRLNIIYQLIRSS